MEICIFSRTPYSRSKWPGDFDKLGFKRIITRKCPELRVNPKPVVKWAGGKSQLLNELIPRMPLKYNKYYEPFFGGGAFFFALNPSHAVINDLNASLINLYRSLQLNPKPLIDVLSKLDEESNKNLGDFYYEMRALYNSRIASGAYDSETAALLVYLNKHCFNGLFRVNKKGEFNVPFNNSTAPSFREENFYAVSGALKNAEILNVDFEEACETANKGDFVFFDSPYAPLRPTNFEAYTKEGFELRDHQRLAKLFEDLTSRGCYCMLTNHDTELIRELYGGYNYDVVPARRSINSDSSNRRGTEAIVTNYSR